MISVERREDALINAILHGAVKSWGAGATTLSEKERHEIERAVAIFFASFQEVWSDLSPRMKQVGNDLNIRLFNKCRQAIIEKTGRKQLTVSEWLMSMYSLIIFLRGESRWVPVGGRWADAVNDVLAALGQYLDKLDEPHRKALEKRGDKVAMTIFEVCQKQGLFKVKSAQPE